MRKRKFIVATRGIGLDLVLRAQLYQDLKSGKIFHSAYGLRDFFMKKAYHYVEYGPYCECCGPDSVMIQKKSTSQRKTIYLRDIPYV